MTNQDLEACRATLLADGVVCLRNVLSAEEIAGLRASVDRQLAARCLSPTAYDFEEIGDQVWQRDRDIEAHGAVRLDLAGLKDNVLSDPAARPLKDSGNSSGMFFYDVAGWKRYDQIRDVAFDSALPEITAHLMDSPYVHFWEDTTFVKSPGTRQRTAFHQDLAYFQIEGDECLIVWIPLDPASLKNGVVQYVRGSHLWEPEYAPNVFVSQTTTRGSTGPRLPDIEASPDDYDLVHFDVEPGDVIIHHVRTIHGAAGNPSDDMRRAISFRYCGASVRYFDRPGAIPQYGVTHALKNGDPLFCDDYPVVWPKPWPGLRLAPLFPSTPAAI